MPRRKLVKKKKKGYAYNRKGKPVKVSAHEQGYWTFELTEREKKLLKEGKAKQLFEEKSKRSQTLDKKSTSKTLHETPNEDWIKHMNRSDVKNIDTPPIPKKPKKRQQRPTEEEKELYKKLKHDHYHTIGSYHPELISFTQYKKEKRDLKKPYGEYLKEQENKIEKKITLYKAWRSTRGAMNAEEYEKTGAKKPYLDYIADLKKTNELRSEYTSLSRFYGDRLLSPEAFIEKRSGKDYESYLKKKRDHYDNLTKAARARQEAIVNNLKNVSSLEELKELREKYIEIGEKAKMSPGIPGAFSFEEQRIKAEALRRKTEELQAYSEREDIEVKKWTKETVQLLENAIGNEESNGLTSEDMVSGYIKNMAKISGHDPTYGLSRSWLGDTEWDRKGRRETTYSAEELDGLPEGTLVERNTGKERKIFRKIDDEWVKVAEVTTMGWGADWKAYGVVSKVKTEGRPESELKMIVESSDDLGTRISAIHEMKDKKFLQEIAITDEAYKMKSEAYQRLKQLGEEEEDPKEKEKIDSQLATIRNFYQESKERRIQQEAEASKFFREKRHTLPSKEEVIKHINMVGRNNTYHLDRLLESAKWTKQPLSEDEKEIVKATIQRYRDLGIEDPLSFVDGIGYRNEKNKETVKKIRKEIFK